MGTLNTASTAMLVSYVFFMALEIATTIWVVEIFSRVENTRYCVAVFSRLSPAEWGLP
jgi:hypothetical protein